jgi:hypothetical protein
MLAGAGLIGAGLLIDWDHSDTLIAMGIVLLPGALGALVKEASSLRAPAAQP